MTVSSDRLNLVDLAKETDPDGSVAQVAEILNETNPIAQEMPLFKSNAPLGNRVTVRGNLPTVQRTKINKGTPKSKGTNTQRVDTIAMYDARSEVDKKAKIGMSESGFMAHRRLQDVAFIEAMGQAVVTDILYGDERADEMSFTGLALRMNTLATALSGPRVISAGGVGADNTSAFVVDWREGFVGGIYPDSANAGGLDVQNLGELPALDKDSNPFQALVMYYLWVVGLTVWDDRHIGRLANIDVSDLAAAGASGYTGPDLVLKLTDLLSEMPEAAGAKRVIYCHNKVWAAYNKIALAKSNAALTLQDYLGKGPIPHFWGYPIRRLDRISLAESLVA